MSSSRVNSQVPILWVNVREEADIVTARQRARQLATQLGFSHQDQVALATAVSEIARNAFQYAGGGRVEFALAPHTGPQVLSIQVTDQGPGIGDSAANTTGLGIIGTRRLMDFFQIESAPGRGTTIRFGKCLPPETRRIGPAQISEAANRLAQHRPETALEEIRRQNTELLRSLEEIRSRDLELEHRQAELTRLNTELEETNRGVVALYAELDEKAEALRRAGELKSRFLSHMSHEFRTPLNSILALSQLLLNRTDGELTREQERQAGYIKSSAQEVLEMVNDLLDLAKVESGATEIHRGPIDLGQLFGVLRGMLRPLAVNDAVALVFEETSPDLKLESDEGKVAQILRNLISNALKFTEHGEVRISARLTESGHGIQLTVADTGIGIAREDCERIFQEFTQVENPTQRRVKGTGLGLPLSRKLATLLGGDLSVTSTPGTGSIFTLTLPGAVRAEDIQADPEAPILIIDDADSDRYISRQMFRGTSRPILEAIGEDGAERARFERPALILLDLMMPGRNGFQVLEELRSDPSTKDIPVVIHTSKKLSESDYERLASRQTAVLPKGIPDAGVLELIRSILREPDLFKCGTGEGA